MEWAQVGTFIAAIGLQSFWIARAIDGLRDEMHRGFDRVDTRLDRLEGRVQRLEGGGGPPSLRQV